MKTFFICCIMVGVAWLIPNRIGIPVVPDSTPSEPLRLAVIGLWEEGRLESKGLLLLKDEVVAKVRDSSATSWQDVFSLSKEGRVYPKHSIVLVFITLPFYALFGEYAFALVPIVIAIALLCATVALVVKLNPSIPPAVVIALCILGSQTLLGLHHYFFGYDLLEPFLLIFGLLISIRFPFVGMMLVPLATLARPSALLLVPFIFFARVMIHGERLRTDGARSLLGLSIGLMLVGALNYQLWGGVLTTAYHRVPLINADGTLGEFSHPFGFRASELTNALPEKLFNVTNGLLTWNLSLLLLPVTLVMVCRSSRPLVGVPLTLGVVAYLLYGLSYEAWQSSFRGNRLLLSAIYLHIIAFLLLCARARKSTATVS